MGDGSSEEEEEVDRASRVSFRALFVFAATSEASHMKVTWKVVCVLKAACDERVVDVRNDGGVRSTTSMS